MSGKGQRVPDRKFCFPVWLFVAFPALHDPRHEIPHRLRRPILLLSGGVGVGAEGESCIVVPQHTADRFHIHAILEGQGRECVSQIMEADVFQIGILQYLFVELYHRVRVVHLLGDW